ncbi:unnamed protein product [Auanema sp. JU1783]|nr:unnamed protein product [Auanema sp. JU1783]
MSSLAVVLQGPKPKNGRCVFESFKEANRKNFWNRELVSAMESIIYMGFLRPSTLFISGSESSIQTIKSEYARRILKAPTSYKILSLGAMGAIEEVEQMNFVPLGDIICDTISQLNTLGQIANLVNIKDYILENYSYISPNNLQTMKQTIQTLISTGLIYRIGENFFVSIPTQSVQPVVKTTVECQTGMSIMEEEKKEKKGILARIFARRSTVNAQNGASPPQVPTIATPVVPVFFSSSDEWMKAEKISQGSNANRYYTFDKDDVVVAIKQQKTNNGRRRRRQHRVYLSSSSECLNYGPIDPPECLPGNVEVVDDLRRRRRRTADRKTIARTSTPVPVGSDSAYSPSPVTDSNEEAGSWSEKDVDHFPREHTYVNLHEDESTQFEEITQPHIVPQAILISNV